MCVSSRGRCCYCCRLVFVARGECGGGGGLRIEGQRVIEGCFIGSHDPYLISSRAVIQPEHTDDQHCANLFINAL